MVEHTHPRPQQESIETEKHRLTLYQQGVGPDLSRKIHALPTPSQHHENNYHSRN